jgi:potassium-dependent mechanosensitive channel
MTAPRGLCAALLVLTFALLGCLGPAGAQTSESQRQKIDSARAALLDIDAAFRTPNLADAELLRLRSQNDPLAGILQSVIDDLTPKLAASTKRLAELTPKSKDKTPETDAAAADLAAEQRIHDDLDASMRTARALFVQVEEINSRIGTARRALFAKQTFTRSASILSPVLWSSVALEAPRNLRVFGDLLSGWVTGDVQRVGEAQWVGLLALVIGLAAMTPPVRWMARRVVARDPAVANPSKLLRAIAALWTILVLACLPIFGLAVLSYALDAFDLSDPRLQGVQDAVFDGLRLIFITNAIARGLLALGYPKWRMVDLGEPVVQRIGRVWIGVATIVAVEKVLEPIDDAVVASLSVTVATRGLCALAAVLFMAHSLRRIYAPASEDSLLAAQQTRNAWASVRASSWLVIAVIFGAVLIGYVALATFLLSQTLFAANLISTLYLVGVVIERGAETVLQPRTAIGRSLITMAGLRRETLEQLTVLIQGAARVALFVTGALLILAPLGIQSQDMFGSLSAAYFGFKFGDVTISLSSIVTAAFAFIVGMLLTRAVQGWLGSQLLPRTRLDDGLRNSIKTIFGYVGFVLALAIAAGQLGLNFQRLALIAGALSVGIGFGLQSVVNNFVSGLIILWERAVRVGDMVMIGAEQGFVRRINVRSTEIETFDRAVLIVPNSNLVSGVVKNWVRADRVGRIIISLNVAFDSDPEKVREILFAAAKGQELVMSIPAPLVLFSEFGDWAMKFLLVCFVDEIEMADRVKSEILFDLHRRLKEAGLNVPYPRQDVDWLGPAPGAPRPV